MKLPRLRFTLRELIFLVGVMAYLANDVTGTIGGRRTQDRMKIVFAHSYKLGIWEERTARIQEFLTKRCNGSLRGGDVPPSFPERPGAMPEELLRYSRLRAEYHSLLVEKYRVAARHPFSFVPPDPPEPK